MKALKNIIFISLSFILLTGCTQTIDKLKRLGKDPDFTKLDIAVDESLQSPEETSARNIQHMKKTNSLWQPGSTSFFRDNRTWKVGDILTVEVLIKDNATLSSTTVQQRNAKDSAEVNRIFGRERAVAKLTGYTQNAVANVPSPLALIDGASSKNHKGTGSIVREEKIQTKLAVVVKKIMPNGNLMIEGNQEVRVNSELRSIRIAGIIRPRDITSKNSISSEQIAEARISYGGKGVVNDIQNPRIGSQIADIIAPF